MLQPGARADADAMERLRAGEESALGDLLGRYWAPLVRYSIRILGDLDSAEDIVQEAFVRLWLSRSRWTPTGTVQAFLYRVVRNLALQECEKRSVRRRPHPPDASAPPETPYEELERKQLRLALEEAVESLPRRRQEVLVLARFHNLSYRQIAEVMGVSIQTVANQMTAALRDLRRLLARQDL